MKNGLIIFFILTSTKAFPLWNGRMAESGQFPATVYLSNCTGVKVGKKIFATAAHCLFDADKEKENEKYKYKVGSKITLGYGIHTKKSNDKLYNLIITQIHVHPTYVNANNKSERAKASDIALFKVDKKTKSIAVAKFNFKAPEVYQDVIIGGYGLDGPSPFNFNQDGTVLVHGEGLLPLNHAYHSIDRISSNLITFRGPQINEMEIGPEPILDFGDSGGPVYDAEDDDHLTIIGINSLTSQLRIYSSSTRIDDHTKNKIGPWIRNILEN